MGRETFRKQYMPPMEIHLTLLDTFEILIEATGLLLSKICVWELCFPYPFVNNFSYPLLQIISLCNSVHIGKLRNAVLIGSFCLSNKTFFNSQKFDYT